MAGAEHLLLLLGAAPSPLPALLSVAVAWPLPFAPGTAALQAASSDPGLAQRAPTHHEALPAGSGPEYGWHQGQAFVLLPVIDRQTDRQ